jgi:predicted PurR-regulated permease PerM
LNDLLNDRAFRATLRGSLAILVVVLAAFLVVRAWVVVQALIIAIVFATALWPWISAIVAIPIGPRKWHLPRPMVTALVYVSTFLVGAGLIWLMLASLLPVADQVLDRYPEQTEALREYLEPFRSGDLAGGAGRIAQGVAEEAGRQNSNNGEQNGEQPRVPASIGAAAISLFGGLVTLGLVLVFTFFLLIDGGRLALWSMLLLPKERRQHARVLGLRIRDRMSRWALAYLVYAFLSGAIIVAGMLAFQVPGPMLYGVLAFVMAVFPGVGPAVAVLPAALVSLDSSVEKAIAIVVFGVTFNIVDSTLISTRIFGGAVRLPMFIVFVAFLIGGTLMGVWGALIATPVAVAVQLLLRDGLGLDK